MSLCECDKNTDKVFILDMTESIYQDLINYFQLPITHIGFGTNADGGENIFE